MHRHSVLSFAAALLIISLAACESERDGGEGVVRCPAGQTLVDGECRTSRGGFGSGRDSGVGADADGGPDASDSGGPIAIDISGLDPGGVSGDECVTGSSRCGDRGYPEACTGGVWLEGLPCGSSQICVGGQCVDGAGCDPGLVVGCFDDTAQRVCNAGGSGYERRECDPGPYCFRGECGTQVCEAGQMSCDETGRWILRCAPSGEERITTDECNPRDDLVCVSGECVSGCAAALKNPAYIGCEYWSVDLPQYADPFGDPRVVPHVVVVANTGDRPAEIMVETIGDRPPVDDYLVVGAGEVATIGFPRADVERTSRSLRSFRITTSEPVVAYQFNPLNNVGVASNDASLLLPANAIGREYYVLGWPSGIGALGFAPQLGWFTVVATREGVTSVTITFSSRIINGSPLDLRNLMAGSTHTFNMQQFEVLNFDAESTFRTIGDVTGTHIVADRPVVVFAGHEEAVIGRGEDGGSACCADHLEQQLFPVDTWGQRYLAVHSPPRGREVDVWRVIAANNGTRINTIPSISGLDGVTLDAGKWVEVRTVESFEIVATQPVMVGQYLVSQQDEGITQTKGDPSFILAVPAEQFRTDYMVLTPNGYNEDWFTVIRQAGATVHFDGAPMPDSMFQTFGTGEYQYAYQRANPGPHRFAAPDGQPFGIVGIGYSSAVSYGYPGGLNLATEFTFTPP